MSKCSFIRASKECGSAVRLFSRHACSHDVFMEIRTVVDGVTGDRTDGCRHHIWPFLLCQEPPRIKEN